MCVTGSSCVQPGVYICPLCEKNHIPSNIPINKGQVLPACPAHGDIMWMLIFRCEIGRGVLEWNRVEQLGGAGEFDGLGFSTPS